MQTIGFSHGKLVTRMAVCTLGALLMVVVCLRMEGAAVPLVLAVFFAAGAGFSAFAIMSGRPALEFDERGITLNTLWSSQSIQWAEVADVRIETMTLYWLGFIPAVRHEHLIIKTVGSWIKSRKIKVSTRLMALPPDGLGGLIASIEAARAGSPRCPAPVTAHSEADGGAGFDPDAAIARYLARKADDGALAPPVPQRPTFGRRQA